MAISTSPIRQSTGTGSSGLTVTQGTQPPTNGNIIVLLVACESVNINPIRVSRVSSVSSRGTAWYYIANAINTSGYPFLAIEIWWGKVVADGAGGPVTVSFDLPVSNTVGNLTEWSGVRVATSPVDIANSNSGQSTTPAVPADFTSGGYGPEELVVIASAAITATPPSANPVSYTSLTAVTNTAGGYGLFLKGGYRVPVAAGTNVGGGTWTISATESWGVVIGSLYRGPQTTSQTLTAHAPTMNATLAKQDRKPLAGSTATMAAAMATLKGTATQFQTLTAGLSAFVAGILKQIDKGFNAS